MSYLKEACGMTRWEGESNKSVYETHSMGAYASEVWNGGVDKKNTMRWFGHTERMNS